MFPSPPSSHTTGRTVPYPAVPLDFAMCRIPERL